MASSSRSVVTTLPDQYSSGRCTDSPTSERAAKCSTPSKPSASSSSAASARSPCDEPGAVGHRVLVPGRQVVEHGHLVAVLHQVRGADAAHVAGTAGDQQLHGGSPRGRVPDASARRARPHRLTGGRASTGHRRAGAGASVRGRRGQRGRTSTACAISGRHLGARRRPEADRDGHAEPADRRAPRRRGPARCPRPSARPSGRRRPARARRSGAPRPGRRRGGRTRRAAAGRPPAWAARRCPARPPPACRRSSSSPGIGLP